MKAILISYNWSASRILFANHDLADSAYDLLKKGLEEWSEFKNRDHTATFKTDDGETTTRFDRMLSVSVEDLAISESVLVDAGVREKRLDQLISRRLLERATPEDK